MRTILYETRLSRRLLGHSRAGRLQCGILQLDFSRIAGNSDKPYQGHSEPPMCTFCRQSFGIVNSLTGILDRIDLLNITR